LKINLIHYNEFLLRWIEINAWDIEVQLNDDELKVLDNQLMKFDQQSKEIKKIFFLKLVLHTVRRGSNRSLKTLIISRLSVTPCANPRLSSRVKRRSRKTSTTPKSLIQNKANSF
jgi:hypothetical protein